MQLLEFHDLADATPPFLTVTLDVSRVDRAAEDDVDARWRAVAESLEGRGVPGALLDAVHDRVLEMTDRGGEWTHVVVGTGGQNGTARVEGVLVPGRPVRDAATWGDVPVLLPVVRGLARHVRHLVVKVDRAGADIDGPDREVERVDPGHDVLHKAGRGGTDQRRSDNRAEDSWERNAEGVARELDKVVRTEGIEQVLLMGDVRAIGLVEHYVQGEVRDRLVRLDTGGRGAGTSERAEDDAVEAALAAYLASRDAAVVDRYREQRGREQDAVDGLEDVAVVLDRGQVDELLITDAPPAEPNDSLDALLWNAVRTRAGVSLLDQHQVSLRDGVGAILRWSDQTTPHSEAPSMPGHGEPPGETDNVE